MPEITAEALVPPARTHEAKSFQIWMNACAGLCTRYMSHRLLSHDDPFSYNETASVSVLAAAAAHAGFVGLAEFSTAKTGNASGGGRCDFWMLAGNTSWAFEFKQWEPYSAPKARLAYYMNRAEHCAGQVVEEDANVAVAGLIMPLTYIRDEVTLTRSRANIVEFVKSCDYAWKIAGRKKSPETYIMLRIVNRFT